MTTTLHSLSIVIPCHNEEEVLNSTYRRLKKLLNRWEGKIISSYELVLVNNGSSDNTLAEMIKLRNLDPNVLIADLRNNYGYQGSISAGLYHASKEMVVTIDADLQDPPEKIEEMIAYYTQGFELVLGVRKDRSSDGFLKRSFTKCYYCLLDLINMPSINNHGEFRLMSKSLVDCFNSLSEKNRYIRSMVLTLESKYAIVYYDRVDRKMGRTKFTPSALFSLATDAITSFSSVPIRLIFVFGLFTFLFSLVLLIYVLFIKFGTDREVPGWAFTSVLLLVFGGVNSLSIGLIGEYISKIYFETKRRPTFLVRKLYK